MLRWEQEGRGHRGFSGQLCAALVLQSDMAEYVIWQLSDLLCPLFCDAHIQFTGTEPDLEAAKSAAESAFRAWCDRASLPTPEQIAAMIETAVAAEREACAKAVECFEDNARDWVPGSLYDKIRREVAAKIRGRSDITGAAMSETATNVQKMHIPDAGEMVEEERR